MRLSPRSRRRLLSAGAMVAPVLALQAVHWFTGQAGPQTTMASSAVTPAAPKQTDQPEVDPKAIKAEREALAWLAARGPARTAGSPMLRPPAEPVPEPIIEEPPPAPEVASVPASVRKLALTGVMRGRSGELAVISGRVLEVGAEVATGWRIGAIDARAMTVRLDGPAGLTLTLSRGGR